MIVTQKVNKFVNLDSRLRGNDKEGNGNDKEGNGNDIKDRNNDIIITKKS
jgi:hypothetical protein